MADNDAKNVNDISKLYQNSHDVLWVVLYPKFFDFIILLLVMG